MVSIKYRISLFWSALHTPARCGQCIASSLPNLASDVLVWWRLGGQTNDSASKTCASIAGGRAELVSAKTKIINVGMYDERASNNIVGAIQWNLFIADVHFGHTACVGLNVAQIADMTNNCVRTTMRLFVRIEMWSGRYASVCVVAELVHMETMFAGSETAYFTGDCNWTICSCLESESKLNNLIWFDFDAHGWSDTNIVRFEYE